jgi:ABC-type transporter MlaC component
MKRTLTFWITMVTLLLALAIPVLHMAQTQPTIGMPKIYRDALNDLRNAKKHLEQAPNDGYGHRDRALRMIDRTIEECQQAVRFLPRTGP